MAGQVKAIPEGYVSAEELAKRGKAAGEERKRRAEGA